MPQARYWLWLSLVAGLGAVKSQRLLDDFHDAEKIYHLNTKDLTSVSYLSANNRKMLSDKSLDKAKAIYESCKKLGVRIITREQVRYPERLRNIFAAPLVLYERGHEINIDEEPAVAIVGTRKPSSYGLVESRRLARDLAGCGVLIVSGMASGIDAAANSGALEANAPTVAVLGCGVDICYPSENRKLYDDILSRGMLISEYPPGTKPFGGNFPARNRIISGLSLGVVIIEAPVSPRRSGALITADYAAEQGRDVFAVPGNIDHVLSGGSNELIKQGVKLVSEASDILQEYIPFYPHKIVANMADMTKREYADSAIEEAPEETKPRIEIGNASETEIRILKALADGAISADQIAEKTDLPAAEIFTTLTILEIKRVVRQHPAGSYRIDEENSL